MDPHRLAALSNMKESAEPARRSDRSTIKNRLLCKERIRSDQLINCACRQHCPMKVKEADIYGIRSKLEVMTQKEEKLWRDSFLEEHYHAATETVRFESKDLCLNGW